MDGNRSEPPMMTEIDHVAIAVRDLDTAVAWYELCARRPGRPSRADRSRRSRGGTAGSRRVVHPAAQPHHRQLPGCEVPPTKRPGHPPRRLPGGRLCRGTGEAASRRRPAHRREAETRIARHHGGLRASSRRLRSPHRAGSGVAGRAIALREPHPPGTGGRARSGRRGSPARDHRAARSQGL